MNWSGPRRAEVEESFLEVGKSHHEVICSLLYMQLCLNDAVETNRAQFKQNVKQFYFHAGCLLDNLARLIYILCEPNSDAANRTYRVWPPTRNGRALTPTTVTVRQRRYIDWGSLRGRWLTSINLATKGSNSYNHEVTPASEQHFAIPALPAPPAARSRLRIVRYYAYSTRAIAVSYVSTG